MKDDKNKRIDFIDLTKGICIILVVISHIGGAFSSFDSNPIIACFRMPLYFFISGIFFKSYEGFLGFLLRKINKLLIPFLFFYLTAFGLRYLIYLIAPHFFNNPVRLSELLVIFHGHNLIGFNPPIWFLIALFNCCILFYIVHYLRKKHLLVMFVLTTSIGITGFILGQHDIALPLYIDVAMTALPFYTTGFWIRRYNFFLSPHRFDRYIPVFIVIALVVMYFCSSVPGMRTNHYNVNIFRFYTAGFAGIFMILLSCKLVKQLPGISYLGRYSVITLGVHGPLLYFEQRFLVSHITGEWLLAFTLLVCTLLVCGILTPLFLKIIPQVVAQKDFIKIRSNN